MQSSATLIASLVYSVHPAIDIAGLVDELDTALGGTGRWDGENNAIFEVEGSRVVVGFEDHRPQPQDFRRLTMGAEATLFLSIGPGPDDDLPSPLEPHRHRLLSILAERINRSFPCDRMLWSETEEVFDPANFAPLVAISAFSNASVPSWPDMALADATPIARRRSTMTPELKSLARRFNALDLVAVAPSRQIRLPEPILVPAEALAAPLPEPTLAEVQAAQRSAEPRFAHLPDPEARGSLPERLAIYVLNTTLMLIALPVGCFLVVYNMIFGEDLRFSARAIAMTSTLVGLAQLAGLQNTMYLG